MLDGSVDAEWRDHNDFWDFRQIVIHTSTKFGPNSDILHYKISLFSLKTRINFDTKATEMRSQK